MTTTRPITVPRVAELIDDVHDLALPLGHPGHLDPLLERIGEARLVLIGEASHGTHEYDAWRPELIKRLLVEQGSSFVAVEGDWPDCARINRWVQGEGQWSAEDVLPDVERWPTWRWASREVESSITWMREWNGERAPQHRAGFDGLDAYSLWGSLQAIMDLLQRLLREGVPADDDGATGMCRQLSTAPPRSGHATAPVHLPRPPDALRPLASEARENEDELETYPFGT